MRKLVTLLMLAVLGMPLMLNLFDADAVVVYSILMACSSPRRARHGDVELFV